MITSADDDEGEVGGRMSTDVMVEGGNGRASKTTKATITNAAKGALRAYFISKRCSPCVFYKQKLAIKYSTTHGRGLQQWSSGGYYEEVQSRVDTSYSAAKELQEQEISAHPNKHHHGLI
jgi:hypothetical protein